MSRRETRMGGDASSTALKGQERVRERAGVPYAS